MRDLFQQPFENDQPFPNAMFHATEHKTELKKMLGCRVPTYPGDKNSTRPLVITSEI